MARLVFAAAKASLGLRHHLREMSILRHDERNGPGGRVRLARSASAIAVATGMNARVKVAFSLHSTNAQKSGLIPPFSNPLVPFVTSWFLAPSPPTERR